METFILIVLLSGIIPLLILFIKKKAFNFSEPILPFIWITAIASVYEIVGTGFLQINISYWFQIYPFLEIIALTYFFLKLFKEKYKLLIYFGLTILLAAYSYSFFLWKDDGSLFSHGLNKTFISIIVILFSTLWFKDLFKTPEEETLWKLPNFYFISAILLYYSSTMLLFLLSSVIRDEFIDNFWLINVIATFLLRIILTSGTCKMKYN